MSRLYNDFDFIGDIFIANDKDKFHDVQVKEENGWEGHRLNFAIKESKTNSVFLELYGGFSKKTANKVFSFGKGTENVKGTKLEIPWEDRLNEESVAMVADFKKIIVDFTTDQAVKEKTSQLLYEIRSIEYKDAPTSDEKEKLTTLKAELKEISVDRHEFIHEYDAIQFLSSNLEERKNSRFRITGRIEFNAYKDKLYRKFKPELIEIVDKETKSQLRARMDIFFDKDAVDDRDFKKEKKVYIDGYVIDYDNSIGVKKDVFFPQKFVINGQKIDFTNEDHAKRFEFLKSRFSVKGKEVYHLQWVVNIFRGSDTVDFTEKDLTPEQKEAIDFGFNKIEDFEPKGGMLGEKTEENRLVKPVLQKVNDSNDFREGAAKSTYEVDDLTRVSAPPTQTKDTASKEDKKEETDSTKKKVDVDLDDLFS